MSAETVQRSSFARVPAAFRLQFTVPSALIGVPLLVFVSAWAIALGIILWIHQATDRGAGSGVEPIYTGASQAALWTLHFMAAYSATHTFPFAMALSFSRRVFVLGTFLAFAVVSVGFGVAFALAAWVEDLTGGYGVEAYNFDLPYLTSGPGGLVSAGLVTSVLTLLLMLLGFGTTIFYRRVGLVAFWAAVLGIAVVLAAAIMLITVNGGWGTVGQWLAQQHALSISGWLILPTVVMGGLSYVAIRKAVPTT